MSETVYTVSEITQVVKTLIDQEPGFKNIWVRGEVSNVREYRAGNQLYFTLKDDKAQLSCVIFGSNRPAFNLEDQMEVVSRGRISVYEKRGVYTFQISYLEPAGVGALALAYEQLKKKLSAAGFFDDERKRSIPVFPKKVAILTSPTGAALHDVVSTIRSRNPGVQILVVPTVVQGDRAATSIVRGLEMANQVKDLDVIILARGGGSIEELWGFNEEIVARAIFASHCPVISAIGHETDFTISDFVADRRAATPTAAGVMVSLPRDEYMQQLLTIKERLRQGLIGQVQSFSMTLADLGFQLNQNIQTVLQRKRQQFEILKAKLSALNPETVLSRGFAVVRKAGRPVLSIKQLAVEDEISLQIADGQFSAKVCHFL